MLRVKCGNVRRGGVYTVTSIDPLDVRVFTIAAWGHGRNGDDLGVRRNRQHGR